MASPANVVTLSSLFKTAHAPSSHSNSNSSASLNLSSKYITINPDKTLTLKATLKQINVIDLTETIELINDRKRRNSVTSSYSTATLPPIKGITNLLLSGNRLQNLTGIACKYTWDTLESLSLADNLIGDVCDILRLGDRGCLDLLVLPLCLSLSLGSGLDLCLPHQQQNQKLTNLKHLKTNGNPYLSNTFATNNNTPHKQNLNTALVIHMFSKTLRTFNGVNVVCREVYDNVFKTIILIEKKNGHVRVRERGGGGLGGKEKGSVITLGDAFVYKSRKLWFVDLIVSKLRVKYELFEFMNLDVDVDESVDADADADADADVDQPTPTPTSTSKLNKILRIYSTTTLPSHLASSGILRTVTKKLEDVVRINRNRNRRSGSGNMRGGRIRRDKSPSKKHANDNIDVDGNGDGGDDNAGGSYEEIHTEWHAAYAECVQAVDFEIGRIWEEGVVLTGVKTRGDGFDNDYDDEEEEVDGVGFDGFEGDGVNGGYGDGDGNGGVRQGQGQGQGERERQQHQLQSLRQRRESLTDTHDHDNDNHNDNDAVSIIDQQLNKLKAQKPKSIHNPKHDEEEEEEKEEEERELKSKREQTQETYTRVLRDMEHGRLHGELYKAPAHANANANANVQASSLSEENYDNIPINISTNINININDDDDKDDGTTLAHPNPHANQHQNSHSHSHSNLHPQPHPHLNNNNNHNHVSINNHHRHRHRHNHTIKTYTPWPQIPPPDLLHHVNINMQSRSRMPSYELCVAPVLVIPSSLSLSLSTSSSASTSALALALALKSNTNTNTKPAVKMRDLQGQIFQLYSQIAKTREMNVNVWERNIELRRFCLSCEVLRSEWLGGWCATDGGNCNENGNGNENDGSGSSSGGNDSGKHSGKHTSNNSITKTFQTLQTLHTLYTHEDTLLAKSILQLQIEQHTHTHAQTTTITSTTTSKNEREREKCENVKSEVERLEGEVEKLRGEVLKGLREEGWLVEGIGRVDGEIFGFERERERRGCIPSGVDEAETEDEDDIVKVNNTNKTFKQQQQQRKLNNPSSNLLKSKTFSHLKKHTTLQRNIRRFHSTLQQTHNDTTLLRHLYYWKVYSRTLKHTNRIISEIKVKVACIGRRGLFVKWRKCYADNLGIGKHLKMVRWKVLRSTFQTWRASHTSSRNSARISREWDRLAVLKYVVLSLKRHASAAKFTPLQQSEWNVKANTMYTRLTFRRFVKRCESSRLYYNNLSLDLVENVTGIASSIKLKREHYKLWKRKYTVIVRHRKNLIQRIYAYWLKYTRDIRAFKRNSLSARLQWKRRLINSVFSKWKVYRVYSIGVRSRSDRAYASRVFLRVSRRYCKGVAFNILRGVFLDYRSDVRNSVRACAFNRSRLTRLCYKSWCTFVKSVVTLRPALRHIRRTMLYTARKHAVCVWKRYVVNVKYNENIERAKRVLTRRCERSVEYDVIARFYNGWKGWVKKRLRLNVLGGVITERRKRKVVRSVFGGWRGVWVRSVLSLCESDSDSDPDYDEVEGAGAEDGHESSSTITSSTSLKSLRKTLTKTTTQAALTSNTLTKLKSTLLKNETTLKTLQSTLLTKIHAYNTEHVSLLGLEKTLNLLEGRVKVCEGRRRKAFNSVRVTKDFILRERGGGKWGGDGVGDRGGGDRDDDDDNDGDTIDSENKQPNATTNEHVQDHAHVQGNVQDHITKTTTLKKQTLTLTLQKTNLKKKMQTLKSTLANARNAAITSRNLRASEIAGLEVCVSESVERLDGLILDKLESERECFNLELKLRRLTNTRRNDLIERTRNGLELDEDLEGIDEAVCVKMREIEGLEGVIKMKEGEVYGLEGLVRAREELNLGLGLGLDFRAGVSRDNDNGNDNDNVVTKSRIKSKLIQYENEGVDAKSSSERVVFDTVVNDNDNDGDIDNDNDNNNAYVYNDKEENLISDRLMFKIGLGKKIKKIDDSNNNNNGQNDDGDGDADHDSLKRLIEKTKAGVRRDIGYLAVERFNGVLLD